MPDPTCRHCGKTIERGSPRYARDEPELFAHYACHERALATMPPAIRRLTDKADEVAGVSRYITTNWPKRYR